MKAYQVFKGEENKHGFQEYDLQATYLSKEKALEHAQKLVADTLLSDNEHIEEANWSDNGKYKSWYIPDYAWGEVYKRIHICRVEEIDIID